MKNKSKLLITGSLVILGIGLSCLSYPFEDKMLGGVIFGLGISILTAAIIDIYEYILNYSNRKVSMETLGLIDVGHNNTSSSQGDIYKNAKRLRIIFNAGASTFRTYQNDITQSIINNNCQVQIVLSDETILKNGMYMSTENETEIPKQIIQKIIDDVSKQNSRGSIELRYSPIAPVGSIEIKDNKYCVIVPYIYKRHSAVCYHTKYKNTGKNNDIYHKWEQHFENVWDKSTVILKYPNK